MLTNPSSADSRGWRPAMNSIWEGRCCWRLWVLMPLCALLANATAWGQTTRNGSIGGTITDNTGAALPGVTVTATSPALLVSSIVRVSEPDGTYLVPDLPVGL